MQIDITEAAGNWPVDDKMAAGLHRAVAKTILVASLPVHKHSELSIVLSSDDEVRALNLEYRGQSKATNVLSFAQFDEMRPGARREIQPGSLGDIVLAYETVAREARGAGLPFADHLGHLVVHGLLHLYGYDHVDADEAEVMENLEVRILAELGVANPYCANDRNEAPESKV